MPGVYQVRGYDLSNMTFVEGERGVIVIDPLISTECAAAALALYRSHRGERAVSAVIYTHSHVDHFGGVKGVVSRRAGRRRRGADLGAGGLPGARRQRERAGRHRDGPARLLHVRAGAASAGRTARSTRASARRLHAAASR